MRNADAHRRNIVLVGPMGSGKSHVGRLLAARLGLAFVDVDAWIEAEAGISIPAIFAAEGESGFRERERTMLAEVLALDAQVVASGGGAVLADANRAAMRTAGCVVYLHVEADEQSRRLAGDRNRPLLAVPDRAQRLAELQAVREPLYREVADLVLETGTLHPEAVADTLAMLIAQHEETQA